MWKKRNTHGKLSRSAPDPSRLHFHFLLGFRPRGQRKKKAKKGAFTGWWVFGCSSWSNWTKVHECTEWCRPAFLYRPTASQRRTFETLCACASRKCALTDCRRFPGDPDHLFPWQCTPPRSSCRELSFCERSRRFSRVSREKYGKHRVLIDGRATRFLARSPAGCPTITWPTQSCSLPSLQRALERLDRVRDVNRACLQPRSIRLFVLIVGRGVERAGGKAHDKDHVTSRIKGRSRLP